MNCAYEECDREKQTRDWCKKHYVYLRTHGLIEVRNQKHCSVEGCDFHMYGKGFCRLHWERFKNHGDPLREVELVDNLTNYWIVESGCWVWLGKVNPNGYGATSREINGTYAAHRAVFIEHTGPLPSDLILDHLCRTPLCVNPDHLDPVTHQENIARGDSSWRFRETCRSGRHDITDPNNVYVRPGGATPGKRICRQCKLETQRRSDAKYRGKKKEANLRVE